jgi:LmbE family N-acetylglucosaminyl deacetylase
MIDARRILVRAPHPDDEIVACGIAALRARAAGARVCARHTPGGWD